MSRKRILPPQNYHTWRKCVLERDKFVCQKCGKENSRHTHHIKHYIHYLKLRLNIGNGITLCEGCHKNEHKARI